MTSEDDTINEQITRENATLKTCADLVELYGCEATSEAKVKKGIEKINEKLYLYLSEGNGGLHARFKKYKIGYQVDIIDNPILKAFTVRILKREYKEALDLLAESEYPIMAALFGARLVQGMMVVSQNPLQRDIWIDDNKFLRHLKHVVSKTIDESKAFDLWKTVHLLLAEQNKFCYRNILDIGVEQGIKAIDSEMVEYASRVAWKDNIDPETPFWKVMACLPFVFLGPFLVDNEYSLKDHDYQRNPSQTKEKNGNFQKTEEQQELVVIKKTNPQQDQQTDATAQKPMAQFSQKLLKFYGMPLTKFIVHFFSYLMFVVMLGHTLLFEMEIKRDQETGIIRVQMQDWTMFYVLLWWVVCFAAMEIYQCLYLTCIFDRGSGLKKYFTGKWNILQLLCVLGFILGFGLILGGADADVGRTTLFVDLILFCIGCTHLLYYHPDVGIIVIAIQKMIMRSIPIGILLIAVWMTYTAALQFLYLPDHSDASGGAYAKTIFRGFFQIFGDFNLDDDGGLNCIQILLEKEPCLLTRVTANQSSASIDNGTSSGTNSPENVNCTNNCSRFMLWVVLLLMLFVLLSTVMLLNMLIAVYTTTLTETLEQRARHHKQQLYDFYLAMYTRPMTPAPLCLIEILIQGARLYRQCTMTSEKNRVPFARIKCVDQNVREAMKEAIQGIVKLYPCTTDQPKA